MKLIITLLLLQLLFSLTLSYRIELKKLSNSQSSQTNEEPMFNDHQNYYAQFVLSSKKGKTETSFFRIDTTSTNIWLPEAFIPKDEVDDKSEFPISLEYYNGKIGGYTYSRKIKNDELKIKDIDTDVLGIRFSEFNIINYFGNIGLGHNHEIKTIFQKAVEAKQIKNAAIGLDINYHDTSYLYVDSSTFPYTNIHQLRVISEKEWAATLTKMISIIPGKTCFVDIYKPIIFDLNYRAMILDKEFFDKFIDNKIFQTLCEKINGNYYCNCVDYLDEFPKIIMQFSEQGDDTSIIMVAENYFNVLQNGYCELAIFPTKDGEPQRLGEIFFQHVFVSLDPENNTIGLYPQSVNEDDE